MAVRSPMRQSQPWKAPDPEARKAYRERGKAKAEAALERLDAGITRLVEDDEAFAEYLRLSGRMHGYSWGNRLLIALQRPDAGLVAGFHRWKELGRPVCKGAKGIQILAPMVKKIDAPEGTEGMTDAASGETVDEEGKVRRVVGFRVAYVFSVRDTNGPAIGLPDCIPPDDDSDEAREIVSALEERARELGATVEIRRGDDSLGTSTDGKPAGWYRLDTREIVANGDLPAAQLAKVLAHELAHHVAGRMERADAETVAEGAAFVVASAVGLDTLTYSAPYIARWAQDVKRIRALLDSIAKVADEILPLRCAYCGNTGDGEGCAACG